MQLAWTVGLSQHPDEHRPERPILLAVDQEFAESATAECRQWKAGTTYQARKARMARTMITIAAYLIAAYPVRLDDSGSGLWVCSGLWM